MAYEVSLIPVLLGVAPNLLGSRDLIIDDESVIYDDTQMMCADITGMTYGIIQHEMRIAGARTHYVVKLQDNSGDELLIDFYKTVDLMLDAEETHQKIVNEMWSTFGFRIYTDLLAKIRSGHPVFIGPLQMNKSFIEFTVKGFFGGEESHAISWKDLRGDISNGLIHLRSQTSKNSKIKIDPTEHYNGMMFLDIFKEMCGYSLQ